ncbi:MAG: AMP-binding protein [Alphaproteobacteria bacterium]|nr:AMP-binding protein [Alphaproteobacteria bacterium]
MTVTASGVAGDKDVIRRVERKSRKGIFAAFLGAARRKGRKTLALLDADGRNLTYGDLLKGSFALSGPIARRSTPNERIGILLPTGAGATIALFATMAQGRVPAMLNFTAGARNIKAACKAAEVTQVLTAHKFIEVGGLDGLVADLKDDLTFHYLEDLREELTLRDKLRALFGPFLPSVLSANPDPDEPGVILFTSGTEGDPKGVVLSHSNIIANIEQIAEHVEIAPSDIFFNPLPMFHCYGLTAGTLWPLIVGYPTALHPSPLQTKIIPKRIFETNATVLFATDTFLLQYMRASDARGMTSLRLAVCGAERVKDETRAMAERRFSFEVLEGYGVTEGSPVLAANQPGDIRSGTVGKLLPGVEYRLEAVEGLDGAGRLWVRGPNVMKGYITPKEPGVIHPLKDGWHDTGDVVVIDEAGYMSIRGRVKRFAKIGGEMVSLAVVENCATAVWPDNMHAATILPDPRKGEQIVLVTDRKEHDRALLLAWAQSHGVPEIAVPKKIVSVDEVPVLGTGKLNYVAIKRLAEDRIAEEAAARSAAVRAAENTEAGKLSKPGKPAAGAARAQRPANDEENGLPKAAE